jgi:triosephosphate isomerase
MRYFFANWKMFLEVDESVAQARAVASLAKKISGKGVLGVFPSAVAFVKVAETLKDSGVKLGAQNTFWAPEGGYTGEVSAKQFASLGAQYALVGHSERRHQFNESNHDVRLKMEAVLAAGLTPVLCVGETEGERDEGAANDVVEVQLRAAFHELAWPAERPVIIAYEPVWAGGTGKTCSPADAEKMAGQIHKIVTALKHQEPAVLYGGSVRPENAAQFITEPHLSGILVGGASAKAESWNEIVTSCVEAL